MRSRDNGKVGNFSELKKTSSKRTAYNNQPNKMFNFTVNILITIHEQILINVHPFPNLELDLYLQEAQQEATNPEQA